jgi:hypothetical protein
LSYSQGSKTRYLVRLQLHEPASSSLPTLLQLKEGKAAAEVSAARAALVEQNQHPADLMAAAPVKCKSRSSSSDGSSGSDSEDEGRSQQATGAGREREPHGPPEKLESL